jgi:hypothetical protein
MQVPGAARLPLGHEAIVFARQARDGRARSVGMSQGVLPIVRSSGKMMVHPGASGLHLVAPGTGGQTARTSALPAPAPLDDVLDRIRAIVASQAGAHP